jgi:hypothetical protein
VQSELRFILAHPSCDAREVAGAVVRLGKQSMTVTRGTVQVEISKMRRERTPAGPPLRRAGAEDHEKYTRGFNGEQVLSI